MTDAETIADLTAKLAQVEQLLREGVDEKVVRLFGMSVQEVREMKSRLATLEAPHD